MAAPTATRGRPHEYLGMSAGLDFERKILVKERAPELLRRELARSLVAPPDAGDVRGHRPLPADRAPSPAC